jgi:hypothetical protein
MRVTLVLPKYTDIKLGRVSHYQVMIREAGERDVRSVSHSTLFQRIAELDVYLPHSFGAKGFSYGPLILFDAVP